MLPALIPLIASAIPAITSLFGGGGDKGGGGGGEGLATTHAALGSMLAAKGGAASSDHPVKGGTDLPPILAATMNTNKSGHVIPSAGGKIGQRGVLSPQLEAALERVHTKQQTEPILRHTEKASRAAVRRVNAEVAPHLQQMAKQMRDRAVQIQATAEHRAIVEKDARHRQIADRQAQIIRKLDSLTGQINRLSRRWHV